jgi:hypothetical protein
MHYSGRSHRIIPVPPAHWQHSPKGAKTGYRKLAPFGSGIAGHWKETHISECAIRNKRINTIGDFDVLQS